VGVAAARRRGGAGHEAARPRPLKIESADAAVHVEHFAGEEQPRTDPALHAVEPHLGQRHAAGGGLGHRESAIPDDLEGQRRHALHEPPTRVARQVARRGRGGDLAEPSCEPVWQTLAQGRGGSTARRREQHPLAGDRRLARQPVERQSHAWIAVSLDEPVATDVEDAGTGEAGMRAERAAGERTQPFASGAPERDLSGKRQAREFTYPVVGREDERHEGRHDRIGERVAERPGQLQSRPIRARLGQ